MFKSIARFHHSVSSPRFVLLTAIALLGVVMLLHQMFFARKAQANSTSVVISQVYGGGGNAGATFKNDFIELFNRGNSPTPLNGWSVQYAAAGSPNWQVTPLTNVTIQPGQYYLVKEALGTGGTTDLPTPDVSGNIAINATAGKVALVNTTTALTGSGCPFVASVVDFVGFGPGTSCSEGSAAPAPSAATAVLRASSGCGDTDSNSTDFATGAPNPRNTSWPLNPCGGDSPPRVSSTSPFAGAHNVPYNANITIKFDEPVNVTSNWFQISCANTGIHTASASGGAMGFTLNPDVDFSFNESCTVTVFAGQVADQDVSDPPDNMAANYVLSFTVFSSTALEHMVMGNPSNAVADVDMTTNYLMMKSQYALSYNCDRGTPNWTSWHLDNTWQGSITRPSVDFEIDPDVPPGCYRVRHSDYTDTGFDRGHMCPSADRTSTDADNLATFVTTNIVPQAPHNNSGPWLGFEEYLRTFLPGSEIYIVSGGSGTGGMGDNGYAETIAGGLVNVPAKIWKVALILPVGDNDVSRVDNDTRAIAVIMTNANGDTSQEWRQYLATVDQVEALTGYDFFSNVPTAVQDVIEARLDAEPCSVFDNGEWIVKTLDASISEAPFEVRINGNPVCTPTKLLAFASRVSDTSRVPQVFDIYSSGYIRMKAGADPTPFLPFGQSLVLGPAIFGTSASFPASTLFFGPQLQRVDIDTSRLNPDGTGTLLISVTANDSGLAPTSDKTNQIMNQTWVIKLHEPTNEQTRMDVAGTFAFTETVIPDATRTAEFQSFRLLQISSMFIDSDRHDVDAFRFRNATGLVTFPYPGCIINQLWPSTPSPLDPSTGILDSLHTDDVGQPNGNTPSYRILMGTTAGPMSGSITPRAVITPSRDGKEPCQDVSEDNLGLWLHQQPLSVIPQGTSGSISYTVVATTDPMPGDTSVQFSATNYAVTEDCTTVTMTVNRVGDTSGSATVDYATSDITASERRDYISATGRLSFAPGETSKTLLVLVNEDSYVEGPETFNVDLSNPSGAGLGAPLTATVTITDDAIEPATNVIDDPRNFVCQHYHDFLNRHPDQAGWDFWTNQITSCGTDAQCIEVKRINVSAAFYLSIEFQDTGYLVERIYKASYGDASGTSTFNGPHQLSVPVVPLNEFLSDTQEIGQGVIVNQGNWQQQLEDNKNAFTPEFVQRSRFTSAFPASMTPAQFVDTLNTNAGNPLSQSERDQLVNDLSTSAKTRAQVLRAVAEDPDLNTAEFNRAFVLTQYFGYLRRDPNDPQDTDYTGYDFWLTKLNQFNGNFVNAEMVKAFIVSAEYRQRFGP